MSSTVTGSASRDWSAERSSSWSSMSPPPVAMDRGDGGPAVQTLGSTPSANCQPLSISVSTNPVASQSVASKAIAAQQLWTSRIHATNKFAARNNCTAQGCENGCGTASATTARRRVGGWIDVDDREAVAVVDQLLHRHRPGRRAGRQGSGAGRRRAGGVLLRTRNPHPGVAVRRRHPHGAPIGRVD